MKTLRKAVLPVLIATAMFIFAACGGKDPDAPQTYTIQYSDSTGLHSISVEYGKLYSISTLPEKTGHEFTGLYDAETGGTQYINASGGSVSEFKDKKNLVLYPQFRVKEYTLILDYGEAAVTGSRQFTVSYGSNIPALPTDLTAAHKEFAGWFTQENCGGVKIADRYGLVPVVSVLNESNFDVGGEHIYLYAGFEVEKFTVTCNFETGMDTEDVRVEYNSLASAIVTQTRVGGKVPITWSVSRGGEVFGERITSDMILYALEYAPVIDFDSNGGSKVQPVIARAGSAITLPTPEKEMAKFAYWEDSQGNRFTSSVMPSESVALTAVWHAKIVFDENGGSNVDDISLAAGETVTLPVPTKDGFMFAGWYTVDREKYTSSVMPATGIELKAGWYKEKTVKKIYVAADAHIEAEPSTTPDIKEVDMSALDGDTDFSGETAIRLEIDFKSNHHVDYNGDSYVDFIYGIYSESNRSSSTKLYEKTFEHNNLKTYQQRHIDVTVKVNGGKLYIISNYTSYSGFKRVLIKDYYITFHYPDTSELYL